MKIVRARERVCVRDWVGERERLVSENENDRNTLYYRAGLRCCCMMGESSNVRAAIESSTARA